MAQLILQRNRIYIALHYKHRFLPGKGAIHSRDGIPECGNVTHTTG